MPIAEQDIAPILSIQEQLAVARAANVELLRINQRLRQRLCDLYGKAFDAKAALGVIEDEAAKWADEARRNMEERAAHG